MVGDTERYRTLLEINNTLVSNLGREALFAAIAQALRRVVPFDRTAIFLHDPASDVLKLFVLESGLASSYFTVGLEMRPGESHVGQVFQSQRPILRTDLRTGRQYPAEDMAYADGVRSYAIVPLVVRTRAIGVLAVASTAVDQYSEGDVRFLQEVAAQVALTVENMKAYEALGDLGAQATRTAERYRTLLEINNAIITHRTRDELFAAAIRAVRRVLDFDQAALTLHDPRTDQLQIVAVEGRALSEHFGVGVVLDRHDSYCGWAFDHQRTLVRGDITEQPEFSTRQRALAAGIRSLCMAPLIVGGQSVGTVNVASATAGQYSEADADFLREVANQVALAVDNMRAYEAITELNARVEAAAVRAQGLLEVNNAIISNLTKEGLFRTVGQALEPLVRFDRLALALYEPHTRELRLVAYEGAFRSEYFTVGLALDPADSHFGWAIEHQRPLRRGDLATEARFQTERRAASEGIRSICTVPLVVRGRSVGAMNLASRSPQQYSEADAAFLQEVANQVALAVENMTAFEEISLLKARLERENVYLQEEIRREHNFVEMVGNSPALLAALRKVEQVAGTDSTVLVSGETGTGKELIARAIHSRSARKDRPLVKVNCAAISAGLVESELFGHVKGAFTGAIERRVGRFELASGGTLFLDEVGELPLETQVKLLRVLQEQEFEPVGSSRTVRVDVRVIAATNRDLGDAVAAGRFRADLFYRLNVFPIEVPPLRARPGDVPQLATFFLAQLGAKVGKRIETVSRETMDRLVRYAWPGNVRELQNVIERAAVLCSGTVLELDQDLSPAPPSEMVIAPGGAPDGAASPGTMEAMERAHILGVLARTGGVIEGPKGAARVLGLHPNTLRSRMQRLGIKRGVTR